MKKIILNLLFLSLVFLTSGCANRQQIGMPNPWEEFQTSKEASKKAGFDFPLQLENVKYRAAKGIIEAQYKIDNNRTIILRKAETPTKIQGRDDISGIYENYPINEEYTLKNGVKMFIRGEKNKVFVANMSAEDGYFSAYSENGMTKEELEKIYNIFLEAHNKLFEEYYKEMP